jgi:hypothetical protein
MAWGENRGPNRWRGAYRAAGELVKRYVNEDPSTGLPFTSEARAKQAAAVAERATVEQERPHGVG